jgi:hypothetical protein
MKNRWLIGVVLLACSCSSWAIYGPSLTRADTSVGVRACQEAKFAQSQKIARAIQGTNPADVLLILGDALTQWHATPPTSALYAARAFCIHEIVPSQLPPKDSEAQVSSREPTEMVRRFENLGIEYFYYSPDDAWTLSNNPVDLNHLATQHLDSQWGRQAFLMMTQLGWSQGGCQEGPDQFREVIKHSRHFLAVYPKSEVSGAIRLELAKSYATWWNVSRLKPDEYANPENYKAGAPQAKRRAIELYREYLGAQKAPIQEVHRRLKALLENPNGSDDYDYFCADYAD